MDQQQQNTSSTPSTPTPAASSPVSEPPQQPPPPQSQSILQQHLPPSSTPSTSSASNPNPNSIPKPLSAPSPQSTTTSSLSRPSSITSTASFPRPWQQHSQFQHFSSSSSPSISAAAPTPPRGSIALGVPAGHPSPSAPLASSSQSSPYSGTFGHQFGGASNASAAQARQTMQGMQGMGMAGSVGSNSQVRPGGISAHQQRSVQSHLRPPSSPNIQSATTQRPVRSILAPPSSPNNQANFTQSFQGHGLMRMSAVGSSGSAAPSPSQSLPHNQPWLSATAQGKPPMPPPSHRPQSNSPSLQQRSHIPPQHHPFPVGSQQQQQPQQQQPQQQHISSSQPQQPQQQHISSSQPQQSQSSHQQQEHYGQQFPQSRVQQSLPHQQQIPKAQASANQKPSSLAVVQPNGVQSGIQNRMSIAEIDESGGRILTKRSIHELVAQVDPSERLDSEVEDILVEIAEDFVDSITSFGCQLAKHRKSEVLEAKDILVHLERNWNMTLPGFSGDEIKTYKKPLTTDIHKERLAAIKKSITANEAANTRSIGQAAANAKGNLGKMPTNFLGSPNLKTREVT